MPPTSLRKADTAKEDALFLALPTSLGITRVLKVWPFSAKEVSWVPCTHYSLCLCFLGLCQSKAGCQIKLCSECYVPNTKAIKWQSLVQEALPPSQSPQPPHLHSSQHVIKAMEG